LEHGALSPSSAPFEVQAVRTSEGLLAHEAAWWRLATTAPATSPLRTPAWFEGYLRHKQPEGRRWLALFAYDGARLAGVLPCVEVASRRLGIARSLWRVPNEYAAESGDPLLDRGLEREVIDALRAGLVRAAPDALGLEVGGVRADSATARALGALDADGVGSEIRVAGSADAWLKGISENLRVNMRKAANRLEREPGGAARALFLAGTEARPGLLDDFAELEDRGWKGEDGGALARAPAKLALYRTLVEAWARAGLLEWHVLARDGRPVAMHMAVRLGRTLGLVRICYDEGIAKHMPGNLLLKAMAEREHADGRSDRVDFLQAQTWNHGWRMHAVPYGATFLPAPGVAARVLGSAPTAFKRLVHGVQAAWRDATA
jgi:CelD/BcsL family acetyltransferase involved in cellulose biosynthesis